MNRYRLGFIGAGNMAEAIARGAIDSGVLTTDQMTASDPSGDRLAAFELFGVQRSPGNLALIEQSDAVLLAIKPQALDAIRDDLSKIQDHQIVISIMAGLGSDRIERVIGKSARLVRVMPNTPLMTGQGMAGVALGPNAKPGDDALALELFGASGKAISVSEQDLHAITAISGSGPAYLFYLAEAMQKAADQLGLSDNARLLVNQTLLGSSHLLSQSSDTPAELRRKVTSPGGTTEAAIKHLDANEVKAQIVEALKAAYERSVELGESK
jgi:pyrroline-5-carboxylate reductase